MLRIIDLEKFQGAFRLIEPMTLYRIKNRIVKPSWSAAARLHLRLDKELCQPHYFLGYVKEIMSVAKLCRLEFSRTWWKQVVSFRDVVLSWTNRSSRNASSSTPLPKHYLGANCLVTYLMSPQISWYLWFHNLIYYILLYYYVVNS